MEINKETFKILILDDNEIDLDLLEDILMRLGFENIIKSTSGPEAIRLTEAHSPDLFFIDIMMPEMSGDEFRGLLKERPATRNTPVIYISGIISKEEEKAISGRFPSGDLIVAKPFTKSKIARAILESLGMAPEN
ncbi:MAG: response regulator [Desulfobacterales bacterium]|nr:response regulator [Desulfobacterales bacterium]